MGKEGMSKRGIIITLSVTLGSISLGLLVGLICFIITTNTYAVQLENIYKRSMYELSTNINNIEVNISKLVATNSVSSQQLILSDLYQDCILADNNLSCLPIASKNVTELNNFINKLGGYTYSLLDKVNKGTAITDKEFETVFSLHDQSEIMVYQLNTFLAEQDYKFSMIKQVDFKNYDNDYLSNISSVMGTATEVPTLIYDGPFSDSVINKKIKGLGETSYNNEQCLQKIKTLLPEYTDVSYVGEAIGKFEVFNYTANYKEKPYYIQVTKTGGIIINISAAGDDGTENYTVEQCETVAELFAKQLQISDMYTVWSSKANGIAYINLAPIVNKVIFYPDLIKIKVDLTSGTVIGWEATNYCYNHIDRSLEDASVSMAYAEGLVSSRLKIVERNMCIIPNEYVGESLAYEFICEWDKYVYYVYLSVEDGRELNIMRVVKTTSGDLIV